MFVLDNYNIADIILQLELTLQIDGRDYQERDVETIYQNVLRRIAKQYRLDLTGNPITDASWYAGDTRGDAVLFMDNVTHQHSMLCGYLQIVRYIQKIDIKASSINFAGFTPASMDNLFLACMSRMTIPNTKEAMSALEKRFGTLGMCPEKRLLLLFMITYRLGIYELVAAIAEIFYLGGRV